MAERGAVCPNRGDGRGDAPDRGDAVSNYRVVGSRCDAAARLDFARARTAATVRMPYSCGARMSQIHGQTLVNVTAIAFGLCSLIAAGVVYAMQL